MKYKVERDIQKEPPMCDCDGSALLMRHLILTSLCIIMIITVVLIITIIIIIATPS